MQSNEYMCGLLVACSKQKTNKKLELIPYHDTAVAFCWLVTNQLFNLFLGIASILGWLEKSKFCVN